MRLALALCTMYGNYNSCTSINKTNAKVLFQNC